MGKLVIIKKMISFKDLIEMPYILTPFIFTFVIVNILTPVWAQNDNKNTVYYEGDQIRIQQKKKIITITGNAFIRKGTQGLKANKIIWYQNQDYAEAFKNVSFLDREQGVLYKGDYVKFLTEKNTVYVKENPSIENKKDKVIIFADTFEANTKVGSIKARGNTRIKISKNPDKPINTISQDADYSTVNNKIVLIKNAILKTKEQWFSADTIDIDQNNDLMVMNRNVRIEDSPEQKKKNRNNSSTREQNSLGDSVLTCDHSKIFIETKYLECFNNVILKSKSDNSILKSKYFLFDNPKEEILATGDVFYHQKNPTNERYMFSDYMKIYQKSETMYFTNEVVLIDIENKQTNLRLDCYSMKYIYAERSQDELECNRDVIIYNPQEESRVFSDYFFYRLQTGKGYVEKKPYFIDQSGKKNVYFYSKRMDIDRQKKFISLRNDVRIVEREKNNGITNSTTTCSRGEIFYNTVNSNDTFTCFEDVIVFMAANQSYFYGDKLVYYIQKEYSHLEAKKRVQFIRENSPTNQIKGTADYIENYHELGYSIMSNNVEAIEFINNRMVNRLQAQEVRYHFLSQSNAFEGFRDVVYINLKNRNKLYSDYLFYDLNSDQGWAKEKPVLISPDSKNEAKNLVYADYIQFNNSNRTSYLKDNIYIFEDKVLLQSTPRTPKVHNLEDYLNCQEAFYYFSGEERTFECIDQVHLVDKKNRIDIFADYMLYNLRTEYGFLKDNPYLVNNRNVSNQTFVYSDTMEFFRKEGISLFHTNVLTESIDKSTDDISSTIECDEGKYTFGNNTNTVECYNNVEVVNYIDTYVITSHYLRHQVDEDYSYVSDEAKIVWSGDGNETVVTADLLESFGKEDILYAKGKVKIDNGENQAESALGIYEPDLNKFTLYGNPLVRDKEGSEFNSEEVYFDVIENTMTLGNDVEGNFIPEDFLDQ